MMFVIDPPLVHEKILGGREREREHVNKPMIKQVRQNVNSGQLVMLTIGSRVYGHSLYSFIFVP